MKKDRDYYIDDDIQNEMYGELIILAERESQAETERIQKIKAIKMCSEIEKPRDSKRNKNYKKYKNRHGQ